MLGTGDAASVGLLLFPAAGAADCEMPAGAASVSVGVQPMPFGGEAIAAALGASAPGGGRPTAAALARALEYFDEGAGESLGGERQIVLVTDGGPNCNTLNTCDATTCTVNLEGECAAGNCCETSTGEPLGEGCLDAADTLAQIESLRDSRIDVAVVGLPGFETTAGLLGFESVSEACPPPAHFEYRYVPAAAGVAGVARAFDAIINGPERCCEMKLTEPLLDVDALAVLVDCEYLPSTEFAFYSDGTDLGTVVLLGEACRDAQAGLTSRVDILSACSGIR